MSVKLVTSPNLGKLGLGTKTINVNYHKPTNNCNNLYANCERFQFNKMCLRKDNSFHIVKNYIL